VQNGKCVRPDVKLTTWLPARRMRHEDPTIAARGFSPAERWRSAPRDQRVAPLTASESVIRAANSLVQRLNPVFRIELCEGVLRPGTRGVSRRVACLAGSDGSRAAVARVFPSSLGTG